MNKLVVFFSILFSITISAQDLSIMTYNMRLDVKSDGENAWPNRKDFFVNQVRLLEPDILGTQEGLPHQIKFLKEKLSKYNQLGQGRNGDDSGEYSALFYKTDRLEYLEGDTFWLSQNPNEVSLGWDASYKRICTYAKFKDKLTRQLFFVFNTHLDHKGPTARIESVKLIRQKIKQINTENLPVILTGDFNAEPDDDVIDFLNQEMDDAYDYAGVRLGPIGTFNAFKFSEPANRRIDYVFLEGISRFCILKYAVLNIAENQRYASDHFPVYVELSYKN